MRRRGSGVPILFLVRISFFYRVACFVGEFLEDEKLCSVVSWALYLCVGVLGVRV